MRIKAKFTKKISIIISIVAILILAIFGFILVQKRASTFPKSSYSYQDEIRKLEYQSSSTEIASIEEDLLETDLTSLDQELSDVEKELDL